MPSTARLAWMDASRPFNAASAKVVNTPKGDPSQTVVSKPESDCLAAVANQVGNGDVSTISVKRGENQIKVQVRVPGAKAPWICEHDATKVTSVYYGAEG